MQSYRSLVRCLELGEATSPPSPRQRHCCRLRRAQLGLCGTCPARRLGPFSNAVIEVRRPGSGRSDAARRGQGRQGPGGWAPCREHEPE